MILNMRHGFGDVLSQAQQDLTNAGYANTQCEVQKVCTPAGDCYTQNVCSAPGFEQGFDANLALQMTPAQLAAQRAYELNAGGGNASQDYFQWSNPAPNTSVLQSTSGTVTAQPGSTAANMAQTAAVKNSVAAVTPTTAPSSSSVATPSAAPPPAKTDATSSNTNVAGDTISIFGTEIPTTYLLIGGAALALLLFKGKS